jgi:hypothetical protein
MDHAIGAAVMRGAYDGIAFEAAKLADNGGIERIEIKFPSGYVPAQVSQVQVQLQKASAHLASAA